MNFNEYAASLYPEENKPEVKPEYKATKNNVFEYALFQEQDIQRGLKQADNHFGMLAKQSKQFKSQSADELALNLLIYRVLHEASLLTDFEHKQDDSTIEKLSKTKASLGLTSHLLALKNYKGDIDMTRYNIKKYVKNNGDDNLRNESILILNRIKSAIDASNSVKLIQLISDILKVT